MCTLIRPGKPRGNIRPVLLVLLIVLGGCAAPGYKAIQNEPGALPERAAVEKVPFYPQEAYYCGPASLAMMLSWAGFPATQEQIAEQVYTPGRQGTLPIDLLSGARRNGALAVQTTSLRNLLAEIAAGHPVLVFQNLGLELWPQWHFAVAYEYDLARDVIVLHSGKTERRVTDLNQFTRTWERADNWAVTITRPSHLPAKAHVTDVLEGAAGLERASRLQAAADAYAAVSQRWPDNIAARMGRGNVMFAREQFQAAAGHFRSATSINSEYAPAWNNLAYTLSRLGRHQEAIEAAERAVEYGNSDDSNYKETLEDIRSQRPAGS